MPRFRARNARPAPAPGGAVRGGATFDPTGLYRYRLTRRWAQRGGTLAWVLLNPNRADAERDDPTIRRCVGFARAWGYGAVEVVNLFAWCCAEPRELKTAPDAVGPENDAYLLAAARRSRAVMLGWGVHGALLGRDAAVLALLGKAGPPLLCLGRTRGGHPRHPLYLPAALRPQPWEEAVASDGANAQPLA